MTIKFSKIMKWSDTNINMDTTTLDWYTTTITTTITTSTTTINIKIFAQLLTVLVSIAVDANDVNTGMDTNITIVTRCSDDRRMMEVVYQSMVVSILVLG